MQIIDRYAYTNNLRNVDPAYKAGFAVLVLVLCLLLDEPGVGLVATVWIWVLAVLVAGLPAAVFTRVLVGQGIFLVLVTAGVAISISITDPSATNEWVWRLGPVWLSSSPESLDYAAHIVTRALGATAAMTFLAMTTPLVDLLGLFRRMRVPVILIDVMTVMYRFIFVLFGSLDRMYVAQASRLGYSSRRRSMVSAAQVGSRLFVDSYQRSQRLQTALDSRGYDGELRVLPSNYQRNNALFLAWLAVIASLFLVWRLL
jgi:cobalt/nickel transport system permease protein